MHWRMIRSIYRKDLRDAIRDSRVLVAILVPIGIGILYNFMFQDTTPKPSATIAFYTPGSTHLIQNIEAVVGDTVDLSLNQEPNADAVHSAIDRKNADVGIIAPEGFDAAAQSGLSPPLTVLMPESSSVGGDYVSAVIDAALNRMVGRQPVAQVSITRVAANEATSEAIFNRLGVRKYFVLVAIAMEIGMIAMLAVPIILTEEVEKRTIDALVLVSSYFDIVVAKALVGLTYIALAVTIMVSLTRIVPEQVVLFAAAVLMLSVTLIGFGLLIGGLFRSANQLNTWGGVVLLPILAPACAVGLPVPGWVQGLFDVIPTSQATKVMINSLSGEQLFAHMWLAFVVMGVWTVAAYAILVRRLARRTA